ncbi:MAG: cysteine desulfurase family protein [Fuerstiella sp.]
MSSPTIYLDNNATTAIHPDVLPVVLETSQTAFANPGSQHRFGRAARNVLEDSRDQIAAILGAHSSEVIFTSGGTESLNAAVYGFTMGRKGTIAYTAGEHPAMLAACERSRQAGLKTCTMDVDAEGRIIAERLDGLPWADLKLVSMILAHNETGVIQDLTPVVKLCQEHRVPLLVDGVQAVGKIPVNFHELGATALAFGAHKFHGPRGIGGLLLRRGVPLPAFLEGGHQESGRRAGTEAVPLVAGMAKALQLFDDEAKAIIANTAKRRDTLEAELCSEFPAAIVHSGRANRLHNTLNIAFPGIHAEALLVNLDLAGIACSLGTTCASGSAEATPALLAMGCSEEIARSSIRLSLSRFTTEKDICAAAEIVIRVLRSMNRASSM